MTTTSYVSCACNCHPNAVDWAKNGLICYAFSNALAIYNPDGDTTGKVLYICSKHKSQIKVVQWIETGNDENESEILSASLDGTIIIWEKQQNNNAYNVVHKLSLGDNLTTSHAMYLEDNKINNNVRSLLICGSSYKGIFTIWHRDTLGLIEDKQILDLKKRVPTEARLAYLPGLRNIPMLIIALDDSSIQIFAWDNRDNDIKINFVCIKELRGHQGWIQCMDVAEINANEILLATGSQDTTIRLWKIIPLNDADERNNEELNKFNIGENYFGISVESVLSGHEHWVYGVQWHPAIKDVSGKYKRPHKLLSTALDKTMIIWEPNANEVWVESVRMGKVGGNSHGYYSCKFNKDGSSVLAHGYQGTFHMWEYYEDVNKWFPRSAPSGHSTEVTDLCWDPQGKYLLTTGADQTTRIHAPWQCMEGENSVEVWHEIARPQIHGYDINCLAILSSTMFASGADEKVIRIFEAPAYFVESLKNNMWTNPKKYDDSTSVPALGLTNKIHDNNELQKNLDNDDDLTGRDIPPTEEELIRHTLWPELEKLYGHGYEIFSMAARHDGKLLATACKSSSAEHSSIILWSTKSWAQVQKLSAHRLTVTQIAFSPNDQFFVSVSRDRRWALYRIQDNSDDNMTYKLVGMNSKDNPLHTRIIWCCAWTHDSKYFATGSRDGKIGIWRADNGENSQEIILVTSLEIDNTSVTALAFATKVLSSDTYIFAVGFDDGTIEIRKIIFDNDSVTDNNQILEVLRAHHKTVRKLAFRPISPKEKVMELASCSSDCSVRIQKIDFSLL